MGLRLAPSFEPKLVWERFTSLHSDSGSSPVLVVAPGLQSGNHGLLDVALSMLPLTLAVSEGFASPVLSLLMSEAREARRLAVTTQVGNDIVNSVWIHLRDFLSL
jgi:hypothetical protein